MKTHNTERLADQEDHSAELPPESMPLSRDFWKSPTLDELAQAQNVKPPSDVRALFGTWPGEVNDGFEEAVDELRHAHSAACRYCDDTF